ncbi:unnamed protein product [Didymodactylos carnosus]|uniref:Uncharacterized protein n=1 Tax=Didymodactylos carnosus TaxID=1234261 RepID=A0A8S2R8X1_9BILA|nr:unnamed protein product [Didymodactylos carnosus]CAF4151997.1 unnamed protein product [Didymodactylos carnosus]
MVIVTALYETDARFDHIQTKHKADLKETRHRTEELENENQTLTNEVSQLRRQNQQLKLEVDQLTKDKIGLQDEIQMLKAELKTIRQHAIEIKKELDETRRDLGVVKQQAKEDRQNREIEDKRRNSILLLSEVAFKFDREAIQRIFYERFQKSNPNCNKWQRRARNLTIHQVVKNHIEPPMSIEEEKRLKQFLTSICANRWDDQYHFLDTLKALKGARLPYAHSPPEFHYQSRRKLIEAAKFVEDPNNQDQL